MTQWGLDVLFNPSKRHMDEEKQRLQSSREQVGDSSGGRRIDLESGKVRIKSSRVKANESTNDAPDSESMPEAGSAADLDSVERSTDDAVTGKSAD